MNAASSQPGAPALHGWLIIDKPAGLTSAQVVARVKHLTGGVKTGHGGTLDPLATGVLPLALLPYREAFIFTVVLLFVMYRPGGIIKVAALEERV